MQPGGNSDTKTLALRLDNQTQRVVIEQSDNDDLVAVGWEMDSEEALFHRTVSQDGNTRYPRMHDHQGDESQHRQH